MESHFLEIENSPRKVPQDAEPVEEIKLYSNLDRQLSLTQEEQKSDEKPKKKKKNKNKNKSN